MWHKRHHFMHMPIFVVIIGVCSLIIWAKINNWGGSLQSLDLGVHFAEPAAVLALNPTTKSVKQGEIFKVDIVLDTTSTPVDGVDVYSLHYNPTILEVIDDLPGQKGVQIEPGGIMSFNVVNLVDESSGTIKFSQVAAIGKRFMGKGVLATINFKAIGRGTADLKFDFKKGDTIDTNAAYRGKDQLTRVIDATYIVTK